MKNLSDLGERAAIKRIAEILTQGEVAVGIGDDCAAIEMGNEYLLVSTDMLSEETHLHQKMTPFQIGWFSVAINLSDLAAKAGTPLGLVLSFGLPKEIGENFLDELTRGADACATRFDTAVIGGDLKETREITICGTAFGLVKKTNFLPRKGFQVGDIVAVTGSLGKAGAGYYNIAHEIVDKDLSKLLFEPQPKMKEGQLLGRQQCITSCMDISDGLSASLYQLLELNKKGFEIQQDKIPLAKELQLLKNNDEQVDVFEIALHFGGDYELLFTVPEEKWIAVNTVFKKEGLALFSIGRVIREQKVYLVTGDRTSILENKGYEHFKHHLF